TNADSPGGFGNNYTERYSGYFIPPTSDNYVFFVASDDDCDVFLSTDSSIANKQLICQEAGYSAMDGWNTAGGNGSLASQKRSDQWTNGVGATPYAGGIPLVAGQKYYLEYVHHQGGGGDPCSVTYETETELTADPTQPVDGSASRMTAASNDIAVITYPGTSINWSSQPQASVTVFDGQTTNFSAIAVSDAEMTPYYQWYLVTSGGSLPGTALTGQMVNGTNLTMSLIPDNYDNAQIYCVATTEFGGLSITSSVATLHVTPTVFESGWVTEKKWVDQYNIAGAENGTLGTPTFSSVIAGFLTGLDKPYDGGGGGHDSTIQQIGYFVPPTSGQYVFFVTSHDQADLFLSTDNTAANKHLVAQEAGWSNDFDWNQAGGAGSIISQKRSDEYTNSLGVAPYASGISLTAGQHYYMEVDHTSSKWGDATYGVDYELMSGGSVTAPADGTLPNTYGNVVGMGAIRSSVTLTQEPTNIASQVQGYATFSAAGTTDSQYPIESSFGYTLTAPTNALLFQWYKNGNVISNATGLTLTLGPLTASDNNAQIYCKMRALGYSDNSLNPIWTNSTAATLTVSQGVFEPGWVMDDWWTNTTSLANVESGSAGAPNYSFVVPKFECPTDIAGINNYVNRTSGYYVPATNGTYIFFVNSDDDSDLFLSQDSSPSDQVLVAQQTSWSNAFQWGTGQKRSDQFTPDGGVTYPGNPGGVGGVPMTAGQKYWLDGVHHDTGGGNNFEATVIELNDAAPVAGSDTTLAGNLIGTYVPRIPWVAFLQQPMNQTVLSGGNPVTFTVAGTNPPSIMIGKTTNPSLWLTNQPTQSLQYQWYKNGVAIPGATSASYTQPDVLPSDQGAQFLCEMRALGYADDSLNRIYSNSLPAVLTVITDTVPPTLTYASTFVNTNLNPTQAEYVVDVTFSKTMNASTLSNATYTIGGVSVTNVSVFANDMTVQLLVSSAPTLPLVVTVNGTIKDLSGNLLGGSNSTNINAEPLTFSDIGTIATDPSQFGVSPTDPAYPSYVWVDGQGGYIVSAEGSDIWNAADGCNFGWELKTNDFDVVVRGVSVTPTSAYAKEGLMVRETLDAGSREWSIQDEPLAAVGGANRIDTSMRATTGAASVNWQLGALPPPSYPNAWLRIQRTNNVLNGYYSTNGVNWVLATSYDTSTNSQGVLPATVYVGICTTSHNNDYYTVYPPPPPSNYNTAVYAGYNSSYVPVAVGANLTVSVSGTNVILSWTPAGGHLESSPALNGPNVNWQTVSGSSPVTVPIGSGAEFFRVVTP
ncbi:MAG TPA: PA14 domain-containing protein, partial [Candidatus Paceibacterota bacterium]|nr:PA14 domain-containing protein [Candidatus Paceibacterota bacterium]